MSIDNINCLIYENNNFDNKLDINDLQLFSNVFDTNDNHNNDTIDYIELEHDYTSNYNVKSLQQILQYYNINIKKMVKYELIQMLLLFEMDINNKSIVDRRIRLWKNIKELKQDPYFSKYILFSFE